MKNYDTFSDGELIRATRDGDDGAMDYLLNKYSPLVKRAARTMYLIGGETEDLMQEGMMGLFRAVQSFDLSKNIQFARFAKLCVERKIYTAVTASRRKKHDALNNAVSIEAGEETDTQQSLYDKLEAGINSNPESFLIAEESVKALDEKMQANLSKMEYQVIEYYLSGLSCSEIAEAMQKSAKSVDNAIQRARNKVSKLL